MPHPRLQGRRPGVLRPRAFGAIPWRSLPTFVLVGVVCALAATAVAGVRNREAPRGLLRELAREVDAIPGIAPRLSISPDDPPCAAANGARPGCVSPPAAPARSDRIARIAARASQSIREGADPNALHTAALIDLLYERGVGKSLQRAISSLQTAARLTERPAPVLADLAAAYIVRAERAGTPRDLLAAIEAASEALEREPRNRVALYNLALALQRFGLVEETADAWRDYLAADLRGEWAREAKRSLDQVLALPVEPPPPAPDAPLSAYRAYAAAQPQRAREVGFCRVLGAWADAVLAGNTADANEHLRRAEVLGRVLEERRGGDATLADAVRAVRARSGSPAGEVLAAAHHEFAAGCRLHDRAEFRAAAPLFAAAAAGAGASPVLSAWARLLHGSMVFHSGGQEAGERIFQQVAAQSDAARHPALAGRARLLLSALLGRTDRYDAALGEARRAAGLFARAGERENEGAALDAMSLAQFSRRDMDEGYALSHRALQRLQPYRASYRLHNLLNVTSQIVGDDGFSRAALRMQDEGVRVADRRGTPAFVAEAYLGRGRLLARVGDLRGASEDAARGYHAARDLTDPAVRGWMIAQWRMITAATTLRSEPARAGEELDSAATFFLGMRAPFVALRAVVASAEARLAAGELAAARTRLESALVMLEQRRNSVRMEARRAAVFETARSVVDRITTLELATGTSEGALANLDRGRVSLAPVGRAGAGEGAGALSGPPGQVALVLATVADTLLAWAVSGGRVELVRTTIDTLRLMRTVESLRQQLEGLATERELLPELTLLYDLLVRPVAHRLGGSGTPLVIVADGAMASVPFAALFDATRRRYLVEDHPLRFAPSLRESWRPARRPGAGRGALFVADPAFDARLHPAFERLPGAAGEVREMARLYPDRETLADGAATTTALRAALERAGVVHYAGHAGFDDERPERSYLLLARSPEEPGPGALHAWEIAELDLRHLDVVVLAACQTVRTGPGRTAGFSGLAGAFLAAGAGGAMGSLWEVDDRWTWPLMVAFHQAYRATGNGPAALRQAQLGLLRSPDQARRSPAAWAAFRYVGN